MSADLRVLVVLRPPWPLRVPLTLCLLPAASHVGRWHTSEGCLGMGGTDDSANSSPDFNLPPPLQPSSPGNHARGHAYVAARAPPPFVNSLSSMSVGVVSGRVVDAARARGYTRARLPGMDVPHLPLPRAHPALVGLSRGRDGWAYPSRPPRATRWNRRSARSPRSAQHEGAATPGDAIPLLTSQEVVDDMHAHSALSSLADIPQEFTGVGQTAPRNEFGSPSLADPSGAVPAPAADKLNALDTRSSGIDLGSAKGEASEQPEALAQTQEKLISVNHGNGAADNTPEVRQETFAAAHNPRDSGDLGGAPSLSPFPSNPPSPVPSPSGLPTPPLHSVTPLPGSPPTHSQLRSSLSVSDPGLPSSLHLTTPGVASTVTSPAATRGHTNAGLDVPLKGWSAPEQLARRDEAGVHGREEAALHDRWRSIMADGGSGLASSGHATAPRPKREEENPSPENTPSDHHEYQVTPETPPTTPLVLPSFQRPTAEEGEAAAHRRHTDALEERKDPDTQSVLPHLDDVEEYTYISDDPGAFDGTFDTPVDSSVKSPHPHFAPVDVVTNTGTLTTVATTVTPGPPFVSSAGPTLSTAPIPYSATALPMTTGHSSTEAPTLINLRAEETPGAAPRPAAAAHDRAPPAGVTSSPETPLADGAINRSHPDVNNTNVAASYGDSLANQTEYGIMRQPQSHEQVGNYEALDSFFDDRDLDFLISDEPQSHDAAQSEQEKEDIKEDLTVSAVDTVDGSPRDFHASNGEGQYQADQSRPSDYHNAGEDTQTHSQDGVSPLLDNDRLLQNESYHDHPPPSQMSSLTQPTYAHDGLPHAPAPTQDSQPRYDNRGENTQGIVGGFSREEDQIPAISQRGDDKQDAGYEGREEGEEEEAPQPHHSTENHSHSRVLEDTVLQEQHQFASHLSLSPGHHSGVNIDPRKEPLDASLAIDGPSREQSPSNAHKASDAPVGIPTMMTADGEMRAEPTTLSPSVSQPPFRQPPTGSQGDLAEEGRNEGISTGMQREPFSEQGEATVQVSPSSAASDPSHALDASNEISYEQEESGSLALPVIGDISLHQKKSSIVMGETSSSSSDSLDTATDRIGINDVTAKDHRVKITSKDFPDDDPTFTGNQSAEAGAYPRPSPSPLDAHSDQDTTLQAEYKRQETLEAEYNRQGGIETSAGRQSVSGSVEASGYSERKKLGIVPTASVASQGHHFLSRSNQVAGNPNQESVHTQVSSRDPAGGNRQDQIPPLRGNYHEEEEGEEDGSDFEYYLGSEGYVYDGEAPDYDDSFNDYEYEEENRKNQAYERGHGYDGEGEGEAKDEQSEGHTHEHGHEERQENQENSHSNEPPAGYDHESHSGSDGEGTQDESHVTSYGAGSDELAGASQDQGHDHQPPASQTPAQARGEDSSWQIPAPPAQAHQDPTTTARPDDHVYHRQEFPGSAHEGSSPTHGDSRNTSSLAFGSPGRDERTEEEEEQHPAEGRNIPLASANDDDTSAVAGGGGYTACVGVHNNSSPVSSEGAGGTGGGGMAGGAAGGEGGDGDTIMPRREHWQSQDPPCKCPCPCEGPGDPPVMPGHHDSGYDSSEDHYHDPDHDSHHRHRHHHGDDDDYDEDDERERHRGHTHPRHPHREGGGRRNRTHVPLVVPGRLQYFATVQYISTDEGPETSYDPHAHQVEAWGNGVILPTDDAEETDWFLRRPDSTTSASTPGRSSPFSLLVNPEPPRDPLSPSTTPHRIPQPPARNRLVLSTAVMPSILPRGAPLPRFSFILSSRLLILALHTKALH
ncbi:hypothetical protein C7M84_019436 [Penaeus vannamei]|uniref:Uncharacterized protein n=1 Tax=Penaeus vannamei TaxID=6689 RepID=A0A423SEV7_PENVA|nr:hypothetical protein C7M84_019436 [Penaeus vannamei]